MILAITPIQPGSVGRVDRVTDSSDTQSEANLPSGSLQDETTNDLSLQAARKSSLLYQVVEKLLANEGSASNNSDGAVFDRFLSSKLANNEEFIGRLNTSNEPGSNIVYINSYQSGSDTARPQVGSLIDIKEDD